MKTVTANVAKQQLGQVLDSARTEPISITKHGRPAFVVTSKEDYDSLVELKYEHFKREVQLGFDALDRGEFSTMTMEEIAAEAFRIHRQELTHLEKKSPHSTAPSIPPNRASDQVK